MALERKSVRWSLTAVAVLWLGLVGADQALDIGTFSFGTDQRNEQLQAQMRDCRGSFSERYDCKSALLRASGQQSFFFWSTKLGLTFGPPLIIYIIYNLWMRAYDRRDESVRRVARVERLEREAEEARLRAKEEGRQRTVAAKRRQEVRQAEKDAQREQKALPLNVLLLTEDRELAEAIAPPMLEAGYFVLGSTFGDALLGYDQIGFHIVLVDVSGEPVDVKPLIQELRAKKDNIRAVAISPQFGEISAEEIVSISVSMGVEAIVETPTKSDPEDPASPLDITKAAALFTMLLKSKDETKEVDSFGGTAES